MRINKRIVLDYLFSEGRAGRWACVHVWWMSRRDACVQKCSRITAPFTQLKWQVKLAGIKDHFLCCLHIRGSPGTTYMGVINASGTAYNLG